MTTDNITTRSINNKGAAREPLFTYSQGTEAVNLSQGIFSNKITKILSQLGYNASLFSGHNLRRGGGVHFGVSERTTWRNHSDYGRLEMRCI